MTREFRKQPTSFSSQSRVSPSSANASSTRAVQPLSASSSFGGTSRSSYEGSPGGETTWASPASQSLEPSTLPRRNEKVVSPHGEHAQKSSPLASVYGPIADEMQAVEKLLSKVFTHEHPYVHELLQHGTLLAGKRMRPALLLLTAKACGEIREEHIVLAAAIEMIHTASLVHDDVLDEAETRRHVPTIHCRWNRESSVLFGDYLFARTFELVGQHVSGPACGEVARVTTQVCEGELRQIASRGNFELSLDEYFAIIGAKTAALCACATRFGALYAQSGEQHAQSSDQHTQSSDQHAQPKRQRQASVAPLANRDSGDFHRSPASGLSPLAPPSRDVAPVEAMEQFGHLLGIAFQIADDVLDLEGDEAQTGKSLGRDLEMSKATLPLLLALRNVHEDERPRVITQLAQREWDAATVRSWVHDQAGVAEARAIAADYAANAACWIDSAVAPSPASETLKKLTQFVIDRRH